MTSISDIIELYSYLDHGLFWANLVLFLVSLFLVYKTSILFKSAKPVQRFGISLVFSVLCITGVNIFFGKASEFGILESPTKSWILEKHVCISDKKKDFKSKHFRRIQCIELETGKRVLRKILGKDTGEFVGTENFLFYSTENEIVKIDPFQKTIQSYLDEKTILKMDAMKKGIHNIVLDPELDLIHLIAMDGQEIYLDLKTISPVFKNQFESRKKPDRTESFLLKLTNEKRQYLSDESGNVINPDIAFLEGKILQYSKENDIYIIFSFENLHSFANDRSPIKNEYKLTGLDSKGIVKWVITEKQLPLTDSFSYETNAQIFQSYLKDRAIILISNSTICSIDLQKGKFIWSKRL